jgi:exodeoxyribonuclease VII large subunit
VRARRRDLAATAARIGPALPERRVAAARVRLDALARRLSERAVADHDRRVVHLSELERLRQSLGYTETLRRGYAVVRADGEVATTRTVAEGARRLEIQFQDGTLRLGGARRPAREAKGEEQGSLF